MPKKHCPNCGKGEVTDVPIDPEGIFTYPLCSNDDCPTNHDTYDFEDPFIDIDYLFFAQFPQASSILQY